MVRTDRGMGGISPEDAASILGVAPGADQEQLRAAYVEQVTKHPPDTDPEGFERVRDAYELLRHGQRAGDAWLGADPDAPLTKLLEQPRFAGPGPWLEAIRQMVQP